MHKTTSRTMQSRARRAVVNSTASAGLDPSVFKIDGPENPRDALVKEKMATQGELSRVNEQIRAAAVNAATRRVFAAKLLWQRWHEHRAKLVAKISAVEQQLAELAMQERLRREVEEGKEELSFQAAFHKAAKMMLADPVLDRITTAALHMMGDDHAS